MKGTRGAAAGKMLSDMDEYQPDEVEDDDPDLPDASEVGKWDVDLAGTYNTFSKKKKE